MIEYEIIDNQIRNGKAILVKRKERPTNGVYIQVVRSNGKEYKLCPHCKFYLTLDTFTPQKNTKYGLAMCKGCRRKKETDRYNNHLETYIYRRYSAIKVRSEKYCTLEEFTYFFCNEKCSLTNRTLKEDWEDKHPNKLFKLEVDHIKSVADGGSSEIHNLRVVPRFWNQLKREATNQEVREVINFIKNMFSN